MGSYRYFFALMTPCLWYMHVTILEPILALRLMDLSLGTIQVGLIFCIMPLVYAITVVATQKMPKWIDKRVRIIIGIAMNFVAFLCVGPSLLLYFPESISIMCIGHALAGLFGSQTILLGMLEMIEDGCDRFPGNELLVASMSAGAYRGLIGIT